ncbi:MAG TPA: hypothetical protein VIL56_09460 [Gaiellaceae bacterium]
MSRALIISLLLAVLAGCNGGTVDRHALKNDSAKIDSIACQAALLANDVSKGASTKAYARVQTGNLGVQASNFADALGKRPTSPGIEQKVRAEAKHAAEVAALLAKLHREPTNRGVADGLEQQFKRAGNCP